MATLNEQFGTSAEFDDPKGGIFCGSSCPTALNAMKLYQAALAKALRSIRA